jgi:hypothetical protein
MKELSSQLCMLVLTLIFAVSRAQDAQIQSPSLEGKTILVSRSGSGMIKVNGNATVIKKNMVASNGVVQLIDAVLSPSPTVQRDQDCPSCPNLDFWCGKTWQDANTRCHTPCPRCQDPWCATCADGEQCFASCTSCAPPVPPPGPAVCGGRRCPGKGAYCCGQIDDSSLCVNPAANQTCCRTAAASDAPRVCSGNQQCCAGQSFGSGATCCGKNQSCEFHVGGMPTCSSAAAE